MVEEKIEKKPEEEKKEEQTKQELLKPGEPKKLVIPVPEKVRTSRLEDDLGTQLTKTEKEDLTDAGATNLHKHDHGGMDGLGDDDHIIYIKKDGTRAFTGEQSMGTNKLTNVTDPTADQDAATKKYVDDLGGAIYGDGNDGTVDINSGSFSSGPISSNALTRDAYFDNLTLSGGNLNTAGYRLFVKGTLTINSGYKVHRNGITATGNSGAAALAATRLGGSGAGGRGKYAGGGGATGGNVSASLGGNGGSGGISPSGGGNGAGGVATATTHGFRALPFILMLTEFPSTTLMTGGAGGGGGGGWNVNGAQGGGGGSGGGVVLISAKILVNNGSISANGGDGADGICTNSDEMGGGGGGGGGGVVILYKTKSGSGTVTASGGTGGSGCTGGGNGGGGSSGTTVQIQN